MRPLFALGPRLQKCADMVRQGVLFADIGSDHGYLPIWLLKQGRVKGAIAADINEGPLNTARANGEKYETQLRCVLSDGLRQLSPEDAQDIAIAGMGGELIAEILSAAPWAGEKHLILQPMSAPEKLRAYLFENNLQIVREEVVLENGKCYSVLSIVAGCDLGGDIYMGAIVPGSPGSAVYARKVLKRLENRRKGPGGEGLSPIIADIEERFLAYEDNLSDHEFHR